MNVPIRPPHTSPSWALTDEDLDKQGIVEDIESLGIATQTGVEPITQTTDNIYKRIFLRSLEPKPPIHPTEAMVIEQSRFEEPADWTGRRNPAEFATADSLSAATFTPGWISQKEKKENIDHAKRRAKLMREEIRLENLRKKQALADQQRLDSGMGWGSDLPPNVLDSKIAREKAKAMIGEKLDAIPGFVWNLDLPTPATALGATSLFSSATIQKKKFQDLLKW